MTGVNLPYEVADGICLAVMKEHLEHLEEEVRAHLEDGIYMHPEDLGNSMSKYIPALKTLIEYFGG